MNAPGSNSTLDREKGFEDAMAKEFPNIQVVARQFGMSDRAKARDAAENMLGAHPDLNGMFASCEPSSGGAALAIKARGLTDKVSLVAFDSTDGMIEDLKNGAIDAMLVQDPFTVAYLAVKTQADHRRGVPCPYRTVLSPRLFTYPHLVQPYAKY